MTHRHTDSTSEQNNCTSLQCAVQLSALQPAYLNMKFQRLGQAACGCRGSCSVLVVCCLCQVLQVPCDCVLSLDQQE